MSPPRSVTFGALALGILGLGALTLLALRGDEHAAAVILDLLAKGERVFAIAGGSHVVKQEPVLRAGFGSR